MLRAIVFDFDGVIANSEPLHLRAYKEVLAARGVHLKDADYYARYLGYDDYGAFAAIAADNQVTWSKADIGELVQLKAARLEEIERDGSVLFPGAAAAIRASAAAVPTAIASGALGPEIRRVLDHAGLAHHFTAIVSAEDTPSSKPAPDPYLKAVARLSEAHGHIAPGECVALEDSKWGLQSAQAAGLKTVGVAQTYDESALRSADLVIPSLLAFDLTAIHRLF